MKGIRAGAYQESITINPMRMNRRSFLQNTAFATGATLSGPDYSRLGHRGLAPAEPIVTRPDELEPLRTYTVSEVAGMIPKGVPAPIQTLLTANLNQNYRQMNTDWFGTCQLEGLLKWGERGLKPAYDLAMHWLAFHAERDNKLSDAAYNASYEGVKSRIIRGGVLPFSIYSGNLGLSMPCHLLYQKTKNPQARQVCLDVAEAILHDGARDGNGLFAADDANIFAFIIPDTGYFATRCMALASTLTDKSVAEVYRKQALLQAKRYFGQMYDPAKGLSRTGYFDLKPSKTYWCRSQDWLIWTLTGILRYLPDGHPDGPILRQNLKGLPTA
ncbi:MAG: glycoside hydrolase family 88 protein [Cytophagaceae bacterium]|nr:glycoside hydrolase family 88 protein [Cytophagaceae bacterium]